MIQEQIKDLEELRKELNNKIDSQIEKIKKDNEPKEDLEFIKKIGNTYFYIQANGYLSTEIDNHIFDNIDDKRFNNFNYFSINLFNQQEVEKVAENRKLYNKVIYARDFCREGWKPDWKDNTQVKYHIDLNSCTIVVSFCYETPYQLCFKDINQRDKFRKIISDDEIRAFFIAETY